MSDDAFMVALDKFDRVLAHYGTPRKSGRYPWGSGDNPQRHRDFLARIKELEGEGLTQAEVAKAMLGEKATTTQLRAIRSIASNAERAARISRAEQLRDDGLSNVAIGEKMGINESSVRKLLEPGAKERSDILTTTADVMRAKIDKHGAVDFGAGTEHNLGITSTRKNTAIAILEQEGYKKFYVPIEQVGTGKVTNTVVMAKPGTTFPELMKNQKDIAAAQMYSEDGGRTFRDIVPPKPISSKRVGVRYAEEGGADMDGVIQLRRGVDDISLGGKNYAQVRISVDGTHYLKGMAMYSDKMPDGVDVLFNTNKSNTGNKLDAMKGIKDDPDLPFGSIVRQKFFKDANGKEQQSVINVVGDNEEGGWAKWSKNLSSQMLSKQSPQLAEKQLGLAFDAKKADFDEIMSLTNPVVKKKLLEEFADGADAAAVHLKAAGLPRTTNQVILPINSLKDNEIYAPQFKQGETVVLIRHPHGGKFEIPELKVNNRNKEALGVLRQAADAVGINSRVAARLSGADFDGDTVLVIPNNQGLVKTSPPLAALKGFDPQKGYKGYDGMKTIDGGTYNAKTGKTEFAPGQKPAGRNKQLKMGDISNLITDMTIKGATDSEIARAVKHSMVVIDAEKHGLNFKQSAIDNGISQLKKKYQSDADNPNKRGASTLISKSKSTEYVPQRKPRSAANGGPIDPKTGEKMWEYTGDGYTNSKGKYIQKTTASTKMGEAKDAVKELSSGRPIEVVYGTHANKLKAIANEARVNSLRATPPRINSSARATYKSEVESLNLKLKKAQENAPRERQAQLIANSIVKAKKEAHPELEGSDLKKVKAKALEEGRLRAGASKDKITFTDSEWAAVQAGAVSASRLRAMLDNADMDQVRQLATPRTSVALPPAKLARAQALLANGYTQAEVAEALGVSKSTLTNAI